MTPLLRVPKSGTFLIISMKMHSICYVENWIYCNS